MMKYTIKQETENGGKGGRDLYFFKNIHRRKYEEEQAKLEEKAQQDGNIATNNNETAQ